MFAVHKCSGLQLDFRGNQMSIAYVHLCKRTLPFLIILVSLLVGKSTEGNPVLLVVLTILVAYETCGIYVSGNQCAECVLCILKAPVSGTEQHVRIRIVPPGNYSPVLH